jgi:hypothetical protein
MVRDIHALNEELIAAGVRKPPCGLSPVSNAKTLRAQPNVEVLITDGPYLETKEHIGGFRILECADMDEALALGAQGRRRLPGVVRGARANLQTVNREAFLCGRNDATRTRARRHDSCVLWHHH